MTDASVLLEVKDLKTYFATPRGYIRAVDGVSFVLNQGRTLGIVGESGCGKSVMSRTLLGLLPSTAKVADDSVIRFGGTDLRSLPPKAFRAMLGPQIAMIFQDPLTSLNPVMKIGRQISETLTFHLGLSRAAARRRAIDLLASVGIPVPDQRVDQYPHQLSGGMRQRVAIAMALACEPRLLIADEPTTALDVTVQAEILDLLQRQQEERNMSLILITHDLGVVAGRSHEVAVMYAGKIVERASTARLFSNMRMPYSEALLRSIPRLSDPSHTVIESVGGRPPDLLTPPEGCRFAPRCGYASAQCQSQEPALTPANDEPAHRFACWHPLPTRQGAA